MLAMNPFLALAITNTKLTTALWIVFAVVLVLYLMKRSARKARTHIK